mmetsp:Transcript_11665/g.36379  ORF Transcript_11665/g.36379 Transcript_11665/m.36379 type:complete len:206 (+) Transcript_11665:1096-1713(+)
MRGVSMSKARSRPRPVPCNSRSSRETITCSWGSSQSWLSSLGGKRPLPLTIWSIRHVGGLCMKRSRLRPHSRSTLARFFVQCASGSPGSRGGGGGTGEPPPARGPAGEYMFCAPTRQGCRACALSTPAGGGSMPTCAGGSSSGGAEGAASRGSWRELDRPAGAYAGAAATTSRRAKFVCTSPTWLVALHVGQVMEPAGLVMDATH